MSNYLPFLGRRAALGYISSGQADKEIEDGLYSCVLIESGGVILGFAIIKADTLHLLMIAPEYQRRGYGSLLLAEAENLMRKEHAVISLQSFKRNAGANEFYCKRGWIETQAAAEQEMTAFHKNMRNGRMP